MSSSSVLLCPNGSNGLLLSSQQAIENVSPGIQVVDCSNNLSGISQPASNVPSFPEPTGLIKRQTYVCQTQCSTSCYSSGIQYNPDDCDSLSRWMWQRVGQFAVDAQQRVVLSWGTCMYTFTNHRQETVTWCDSQWAQIGAYIARPCLSGGSNGGGACDGSDFQVQVLTNDGSTNTPTPLPPSGSLAPNGTFANSTDGIPPPPPGPSIGSPFRNGSIPLNNTMTPNNSTDGGGDTINPSSLSDSNANNSNQKSKIAVLPIALGVTGIVLVIILSICGLALWRRARRKKQTALTASSFTYMKKQLTSQESIFSHQPMLMLSRLSVWPQPDTASMSGSGCMKDAGSTVGCMKDVGSTVEEAGAREEGKTGEGENTSRPPTGSSTYTLDLDPFRALRSTFNRSKSPA